MPQISSTRNIKWGVFSVAKHLGSKRKESSIDFTTKYPILLHYVTNARLSSHFHQSQKLHVFRFLIQSEHNPCCTFHFCFKRFNHNTGDYYKHVFDIYTSVEPLFSRYTHLYLLFVVNRELSAFWSKNCAKAKLAFTIIVNFSQTNKPAVLTSTLYADTRWTYVTRLKNHRQLRNSWKH